MTKQETSRISAVLWSGLIAFIILFVGQTIWGLLLTANFKNSPRAAPWSVAVMIVALWLLWQYLGGRWWPRSTSEARKRNLRANPVSGAAFAGALLAGVLALIALAGFWIVFFQLVKTPANVLDDPSKYPLLTIVLVVGMSSLVSPVVEEIAFRGYCQQILERRFSGLTAVLLSSLLFMLAHANHGWYWPKLSVYFLAGVVFGAIARFTNSILTSLPVHVLGDLTFFILIWPRDSTRVLVTAGGADKWFWIHVAQAIVFATLALDGISAVGEPGTCPRNSKNCLKPDVRAVNECNGDVSPFEPSLIRLASPITSCLPTIRPEPHLSLFTDPSSDRDGHI